MNYEIASLKDVHNDVEISVIVDGNEYVVMMMKKYAREYHHRNFASIEEAYAVFEKLSKAVVMGLYSWEDRLRILQGVLV